MTKRFALALAAALTVAGLAQAQEVKLKTGAVYSGYVSEQNPSGRACITYTNATFTIPGDSLSVYSSGDRTEVRWGKNVFESVDILEEGDMVTFTTNRPGSIYVKVSDIERISYPYSEVIHDVVVADKSYEGTIVETIVGKYLKMEVDGRIITIADNKIRSQSKVSVDRNKNLNVKMFPYLDIYEVKDMSTLTGALISQNFLDGSAIFLTREGSLMPLTVSKITSIRKVPNDAYEAAPVSVEEDDAVDVRINGNPAIWLEAKIDKKKEVVSFSVEDLGKSILAVTDDFVAVNVKEGGKDLILVPFEPFSAKSHTITLGKVGDLQEDVALKPSTSYASLGRKVTEYDKVEPGFYVFVDVEGKRVAPIWVTGR